MQGTLHPAPELSPADFIDWFRRWSAAEVDHQARIAEIHASFKRKGDGVDNALLEQYIHRIEQVRDGGLDKRQWGILRQRIESMEVWMKERERELLETARMHAIAAGSRPDAD